MLKALRNVGAVFALSAPLFSAFAQMPGGTRLGLKAGVSISTLDGVLNAAPQTRGGLVLGPVLRFKPSSQDFAVQVEALLSSQGANMETDADTRKYAAYYLNVPLLLRQYIGRVFYVNVGAQPGLLVGNGRGVLKPGDVAAVGGLGLETARGFVLDVRLNYGPILTTMPTKNGFGSNCASEGYTTASFSAQPAIYLARKPKRQWHSKARHSDGNAAFE